MRRFYPFFLVFLVACATYYHQNYKFSQAFEAGNLQLAANILESQKNGATHKDRLLWFMNLGTVHSIMGNYAVSNGYLEKAYTTAEDYHVNYLNEGLSYFTNPTMVEYKGEDHEVLLIHYYAAINYLKMGQPNEALVECKRLNDKLNRLGDKYKGANKYKRDAFINILMGIIYDVNGAYNDAFISYRNAYTIYEDDYKKLFNLSAPLQLKKDLIRTAYQSGFNQEAADYEKKFSLKYTPNPKNNGELVFFWHNGLGPVKAEWGITFTIIRGQSGQVTFHNEDLGINFPFFLPVEQHDKANGLAKLEFIRVVFPKYVERPVVYQNARLTWNNQNWPLEEGMNVNAIGFVTLRERMVLEIGKSILRVALKKVEEYEIRSKDQGLGAAVGFLNALTEKADTRNWQTLPHSISYARISLPPGPQVVNFAADGRNGPGTSQTFNLDVKPGQIVFQTQHSLDYQHIQGL